MRFVLIGLMACVLTGPALADGHGAGGHSSGEKSGKKDRFAAVDTNSDGKISRAEFIAVAEKRFAKMDKDGNGSLSKEEMKPRKGKRGKNGSK
jgi:hypothetical protein